MAETTIEDGDQRVAVTVSLGGTTYRDSSDSADSIVAEADAALYRAKSNGRNLLVLTAA